MTTTKRLLAIGSILYTARMVMALISNVCSGTFANLSSPFSASATATIILFVFLIDLLVVLLPAFLCLRRDFTTQRKTPAVWLLIICCFSLISSAIVFVSSIPRYLLLNSIGALSLIYEELFVSLRFVDIAAIILLLIAAIQCLRIPKEKNRHS